MVAITKIEQIKTVRPKIVDGKLKYGIIYCIVPAEYVDMKAIVYIFILNEKAKPLIRVI